MKLTNLLVHLINIFHPIAIFLFSRTQSLLFFFLTRSEAVINNHLLGCKDRAHLGLVLFQLLNIVEAVLTTFLLDHLTFEEFSLAMFGAKTVFAFLAIVPLGHQAELCATLEAIFLLSILLFWSFQKVWRCRLSLFRAAWQPRGFAEMLVRCTHSST